MSVLYGKHNSLAEWHRTLDRGVFWVLLHKTMIHKLIDKVEKSDYTTKCFLVFLTRIDVLFVITALHVNE